MIDGIPWRPAVASFALWFAFATPAHALSKFQKTVPHGTVKKCQTCHVSDSGGKNWNDFGVAAKASLDGGEPRWALICDLDSDGDGWSNGEELQDPDCAWAKGAPSPGDSAHVTAPGDPTSHPEEEDPLPPVDEGPGPVADDPPTGEDAGPMPPDEDPGVAEHDAARAASDAFTTAEDDTTGLDAGPPGADDVASGADDVGSGAGAPPGGGGGRGCGQAPARGDRGAAPLLLFLALLGLLYRRWPMRRRPTSTLVGPVGPTA